MQFENFALNVLKEDFGLAAEKIAESSDETPDFIVSGDNYTLLIELKEKGVSENSRVDRDNCLSSGELFISSTKLNNCKKISKVVSKAKGQIDKVAKGHEFKLLWLHATGPDADSIFDKFICTLFGKADIFDSDMRENKSCYYFDYSDFYRHREYLDGAILSKGDNILLAINNYSPKYREFLDSSFTQRFEGCIIDPTTLEKDGNIWIADCEIPRKYESHVLEFLKEKYGLKNPVRITFTDFRTEFSMRTED